MVASFKPVVYFGGLTALSMLTTSVAALLIVPVALLLARPRFLEPPGGKMLNRDV
jgi:predicted RND superfamily exporter protein